MPKYAVYVHPNVLKLQILAFFCTQIENSGKNVPNHKFLCTQIEKCGKTSRKKALLIRSLKFVAASQVIPQRKRISDMKKANPQADQRPEKANPAADQQHEIT